MNDMNLQPHQQRVVDEKRELDEKLGKLITFIHESVFTGLSKEEQKLLVRQQNVMTDYSQILAERIAAFTYRGKGMLT